jgi:TPR repeat protein
MWQRSALSTTAVSACRRTRAKPRGHTSAAEARHPQAMFNLADLYRQGQGVPRDFAEAHVWWRLAADRGLREAQRNLILLERAMSEEDRRRAEKLYAERR